MNTHLPDQIMNQMPTPNSESKLEAELPVSLCLRASGHPTERRYDYQNKGILGVGEILQAPYRLTCPWTCIE